MERSSPCLVTVYHRDNSRSCVFCLASQQPFTAPCPGRYICMLSLPQTISTAPSAAFYVSLSSKASGHRLRAGSMKSAGIGSLMLPTQIKTSLRGFLVHVDQLLNCDLTACPQARRNRFGPRIKHLHLARPSFPCSRQRDASFCPSQIPSLPRKCSGHLSVSYSGSQNGEAP